MRLKTIIYAVVVAGAVATPSVLETDVDVALSEPILGNNMLG
jgi:hypothetical protein